MRVLLQRVSEAAVTVGGRQVAAIGPGLLALVGVARNDDEAAASWLADKTLGLRIFPDDDKPMNRSVTDIGGEILVVSQFTLAADTKKGTRASFTRAAPPELGRELFEHFVVQCKKRLNIVETGVFGANMHVSLTNDGPVTFWLES